MIKFKKHSGIYTLLTTQTLDIPIEEAWKFFSDPKNLEVITPPHMKFRITSDVGEKVYAGQIITYKVSVLPKIRQNWVTEITQVNNHSFFIDEQRHGPYKMWHHEHWFEKKSENQTVMKDKISYKIPFGILGDLAQFLFIKNQLKNIFEYRRRILNKLFNEK